MAPNDPCLLVFMDHILLSNLLLTNRIPQSQDNVTSVIRLQDSDFCLACQKFFLDGFDEANYHVGEVQRTYKAACSKQSAGTEALHLVTPMELNPANSHVRSLGVNPFSSESSSETLALAKPLDFILVRDLKVEDPIKMPELLIQRKSKKMC
jgi:hypothetical protein